MQIDHDPKEPSRRSIVIMSIIAGAITLGIMLALGFGVRSVMESLPTTVLALFVGLVAGFVVGMRVGWWDCERYHSRTKGKEG